MTTDQTDHRTWADKQGGGNGNFTAVEHLLAAIHDGQAEQTEWLHRIRDLLAVMAEPKGDPCPCECRRDVEPDPVQREWGSEFDDVIGVVQSRAISIEDAWAVLTAARPAIEREAKAAAWADGYEAGWWACHDEDDEPRNPYQEADQ